jgi:hypothetical protein
MLGVQLNRAYVQQLRDSLEDHIQSRRHKELMKKEEVYPVEDGAVQEEIALSELFSI